MNSLALKTALREGRVVIGTWVFEFNTPGIPRILASAGVDFVVYDMEHSGFGIESIRALIAQSHPLNLAALVRPPAGHYHLIAPVLDTGANGIIAPRVETAQEATQVAHACRYPPDGNRGAAFTIAHDDFLPGDVAGKMKSANEAMICCVLIETELGIEKLPEILSLRGIDLVWVGFLDLSLSLGIPGQYSSPRFENAIHRILSECKLRGVPAGILVGDSKQAVERIKQGFQCISYSGDIWLLQRALADGIQSIRAAVSRGKIETANTTGAARGRHRRVGSEP